MKCTSCTALWIRTEFDSKLGVKWWIGKRRRSVFLCGGYCFELYGEGNVPGKHNSGQRKFIISNKRNTNKCRFWKSLITGHSTSTSVQWKCTHTHKIHTHTYMYIHYTGKIRWRGAANRQKHVNQSWLSKWRLDSKITTAHWNEALWFTVTLRWRHTKKRYFSRLWGSFTNTKPWFMIS